MMRDINALKIGTEQLMYKQRNSPTCITSSLASALYAYGIQRDLKPLVAGTESIFALGRDAVVQPGPTGIIPTRITKEQFFKIVDKHARGLIMTKLDVRDPLIKKDPVAFLHKGCLEHKVYSVLLLTKKITSDHAIAVHGGKVYDSTFPHPLRLDIRALDLCCNGEGFLGIEWLYELAPRT